jgi:PAS domain S-box-containing protein
MLNAMDSLSGSTSDFVQADAEHWSCRARLSALERALGPLNPRRRGEGVAGSQAGLEARVVSGGVGGDFGRRRAMLFVADLVEGSFLWVNQGAAEVLNYPTRQLLESSFLERVHPEDLPRTMAVMERLAAGQPVCCFRNRHRHADGSYRVLEWTAVADADGETCYAMAVEVEGSPKP